MGKTICPNQLKTKGFLAMQNHKINQTLYECLSTLDRYKFKVFYSIFVHCWAQDKSFITTQNLFNLWCELNALCHELDESFPDQYDDHKLIKSFCQAHPYYFIDMLPLELVAKLLSKYCDQNLAVLTKLGKILQNQEPLAVIDFLIDELDLNIASDELINEIKCHIDVTTHF